MKKALLAIALALGLTAPAHADGVLILVDSLATSAAGGAQGATQDAKNIAPFMDLLSRSLKPRMKMTISTVGGTSTAPTWSLAELRDSISTSGNSPKYDYSLIVCLSATDNSYLFNTNNRAIPQLTLAANRPKVPVLYLSTVGFLHNYVGDDTLGAVSAPITTVDSLMVTSPAGYAFAAKVGLVKRSTGASGDYVTPVLWVAGIGYSKTDPDGYAGTSSSARDSMAAWFYNPPILPALVGTGRTTTGYGVLHLESGVANAGGANNPTGTLAVIAVGMAAKLAPSIFQFPGARIALDVDDGCKRFSTASSYPQVEDALAGLDSLGVNKIPYTLGVEIDSLGAQDDNGNTRFQNEFARIRRYGMGKVTVHCHKGLTAGGSVTDTTLASAASGIYTDIFGVAGNRRSFGSTSGTTRDQSTYALLNGATRKLIDYAGDASLVTRHVMPPTDNYKTVITNLRDPVTQLRMATYDSISYAIALAGAGYKGFGGYRIVRTQYQADQYNVNVPGNTGGLARGFSYPLPAIYTIANALTPAVTNLTTMRLLYVTSAYMWGTTTDTSSTLNYGSMRAPVNQIITTNMGLARNYDMTTAQEAAASSAAAPRGSAKALIFVTHLPNWRNGIGLGTTVYNGGRPAWEMARQVNAAMEAAKWCALQANTSTTTYFRDGPMKWIYSDEFTDKDLR